MATTTRSKHNSNMASMASTSPAPASSQATRNQGLETQQSSANLLDIGSPGLSLSLTTSTPTPPHPNSIPSPGASSLSSSKVTGPTTLQSFSPPSQSLHPSPADSEFTYTHCFSSAVPITNAQWHQSQSSSSSNQNSLSSSPRRYPTDLTNSIPEECDETGSDSPDEPITPISGRQSCDFHAIDHEPHNGHLCSSASTVVVPFPEFSDITLINQIETGLPLVLETAATPPPGTPQQPLRDLVTTTTTTQTSQPGHAGDLPTPQRLALAQTIRRTSSFSLKPLRRMFSFRRASSNLTDNATPDMRHNAWNGESGTDASSPIKMTPNGSQRNFSMHRSAQTTRSNTPPTPGSSLEMPRKFEDNASRPVSMIPSSVPFSSDFFENKKNRALTGFSLRGTRIKFGVNGITREKSKDLRRVRSMERKRQNDGQLELQYQPWAIPPAQGTGMKARRLSLSLPDDFNVDVAELSQEYEYQHKLLGRHGKHVGKGATSKVSLMTRKGVPGELYAVKEFRGKKKDETKEDYEKKIKSEYSIAKSLHHPNIVETVRLCSDRGRWNHVMEYCSEGELFRLVNLRYLTQEGRQSDRCCLFKQLCQGLFYLHSNGIAHRDVKIENLLMTKDSKLKITDFGVSEVFCGIHPGLREAGGQCGKGMDGEIRRCKPGICGSFPYIAPEVLSKQGDYDPRAADVWSAAIVMIYLTFGGPIWPKAELGVEKGEPYDRLVRAWGRFNMKKAENPDFDENTYPNHDIFREFINPTGLRRLLLRMLNPDPEKRITMAEVMNSRWMKNVECCQLESYEDPVKFIDVSKKDCLKSTTGKIYCHNHLPPQSNGSGLPPMPGKPGY